MTLQGQGKIWEWGKLEYTTGAKHGNASLGDGMGLQDWGKTWEWGKLNTQLWKEDGLLDGGKCRYIKS